MEGSPLGRTHDGGGHEALHHIPGEPLPQAPAAPVTGRRGGTRCGASFPPSASEQESRLGVRSFERPAGARVRNELVRRENLLDDSCQSVMTHPHSLPRTMSPRRLPRAIAWQTAPAYSILLSRGMVGQSDARSGCQVVWTTDPCYSFDVRNELVRWDDLLDAQCQNVWPDPCYSAQGRTSSRRT